MVLGGRGGEVPSPPQVAAAIRGQAESAGAYVSRPFVSVVTPFYNSAAYLRECIESVLGQTHTDFEYILLDNRSSDGSAEIARSYACTDERIRFIEADTHLPQLPNYNRALRLISAESVYCKVAQADDWLFPECVERMVDLAEQSNRVAVVGCYLLKDGKDIRCDGLRFDPSRAPAYPGTIVPGREACRRYLLNPQSVFGTPTSVLYRSDLVRANGEFYPETSLMGDCEACYRLVRDRDFGFVFQVLAYGREHDDSLTQQIRFWNPYPLHQLILLRKYGADCLDPAEAEERWRTLGGQYFRFLGGRVLQGADAAFWEYHRRGWSSIGLEITQAELGRYAVWAALDLMLNPKATFEELLLRWRARRRS